MTDHEKAVDEALGVLRMIVLKMEAGQDDLAHLHIATTAHLARIPDDGVAEEWAITGEHTVTIRYSFASEASAFVRKARKAAVDAHAGAAEAP